MFDRLRYTIGWICALRKELVAATRMLDEEHNSDDYEGATNDNNTYTFGSIRKHNIVIATLPIGMYGESSATGVAQDMMRSFTNVKIALMVGIGGGAPLMRADEKKKQDIRLGDVIVSVPTNIRGGVLQYDYGKKIQNQEEFEITSFLSSPPHILLTAVNKLGAQFEQKGNGLDEYVAGVLEKHKRLRAQYQRPGPATDCLYDSSFVHTDTNENCLALCKEEHTIQREARGVDADVVAIHEGLIASANQLMKDAPERDRLARKYGILCFEMEAAGLMNLSRFLVIRGICDYSDTHKNDTWQGYAAMTAAAYARMLLLQLQVEKVKEIESVELVELRNLIDGMSSNITSMDLHLLQHTTTSLQAKIKSWLAASSPEIDFLSNLKLRCSGTGAWFSKSDTYQNWKASTIRNLWLSGKQGCGKSVMSATIIEDIKKHCAEHTDSGYAFFYFTFSDKSKQSRFDCVRSIVLQLYGNQLASSPLERLYRTSMEERLGDNPVIEENLQDILFRGVTSYKQFFLILDGLDEISDPTTNSINPRQEVLEWLCELSKGLQMLQIMITSCSPDDIKDQVANMNFHMQSMKTSSIDIDISRWVTEQVDMDSTLCKLDETLRREIKETFIKNSDGMFRWAYYQMKELRSFPSTQPADIRQALSSLPKTLEEMYNRILNKIPQSLQETASNLLRWIAYSTRPLSLLELSETRIIKLDKDKDCVETRNRGLTSDVLRMLSGLVVVTEPEEPIFLEIPGSQANIEGVSTDHNYPTPLDQKNVRLAHFSIQKHLESCESSGRPQKFYFVRITEQQFLSHCCMVYINHYAGAESITKTIQDFNTFPLLEYAARRWYTHCSNPKDVTREVEFLTSEICLNTWTLLFDPSTPWVSAFHKNDEHNPKALGLYFAAFCGLLTVTERMIEAEADVNARAGWYGNALQAACVKGHASIVKRLIAAKADVNAHGGKFGNALQAACVGGHKLTVEMLIDDYKANVNAQGGWYGSALQAACSKGHASIVKRLIAAKADVNAHGGKFGNALQAACIGGHASVVKILTKTKVDIDARHERYGTALQAACEVGHESIVKMLIEANANINTQGGVHGSALQAACSKGHASIVRMLMEAGAKINTQGGVQGYALHAACIGGHRSIVTTLIEDYEADVNCVDREGRTALHHLARGSYITILRRLIEARKSNPEVKDKHGKTILDYACLSGDEEMVKFVIGIGPANLSGRWSPMHWACRVGSFECLRLLSAAKITATSVETKEPSRFWTPLDIAVYHGNRKLVSERGDLVREHNWRELAESGLVTLQTNELTGDVVRPWKNSFHVVEKSFMGRCDGCLMDIHGDYLHCQECDDLDYCFMCRLGSETTHLGHQRNVK